MTKVIQLKLSKIKYSGDSIGDDICAEIEVLGKILMKARKGDGESIGILDVID